MQQYPVCMQAKETASQHQRKYRGQKGAVEACKNCAKSIQTRQGAGRPRSIDLANEKARSDQQNNQNGADSRVPW
jgi:hypothetical protein